VQAADARASTHGNILRMMLPCSFPTTAMRRP
jgi:hypothetical protein